MTNPAEAQAASLETPQDAGEGQRGVVQRWCKELTLADKHEKNWREAATDAVAVYRDEGNDGEPGYSSRSTTKLGGSGPSNRFNILFSNVQTICPALYNVMPRPDVRRRYRDRDPVGREVSTILEHALSFGMDVYDFHLRMKQAVKDMQLTGRGVTRVRYKPYLVQSEGKNPDGKPEQKLAYEAALCEHVQWKDYRQGPGCTWDAVPWIAFRHRLRKHQVQKAFGAQIAEDVQYDYTPEGVDEESGEGKIDLVDTFKRCTVWEIWDKDTRRVLWISESFADRPLRVDPDPLNLEGFFCIPRPLYAIDTTDSLRPIEPFRFYRQQAIELDRLTKRIETIVKACIAGGVFDARFAKDIENVVTQGDAMFIPAEDVAAMVTTGGIENHIWMWPVDKIAAALVYLYQQREALKQTIYEITGIADIMRGATDARETLGSQRLKAQFGTMRIDDQKREVERYARDLLRLKAEIIAEKFSVQTLQQMTGVQLPFEEQKQAAKLKIQRLQAQGQPIPQQLQALLQKPTWEKALVILKSDGQRGFRIDIETDQTAAGDVMEEQKNVTEFFRALSGFFQAVGPAVEAGFMPVGAAAKLAKAGMRRFKFGREVEDVFEEIGGEDDQGQGQRQAPGQNAENAQAQAEQQKAAGDIQAKLKAVELKAQADREIGLEKARLDAENAQREIDSKSALAKEKQDADIAQGWQKIANQHEIAKMQAQAQTRAKEMQAQQKPREKAA